MRNLIVFIWRNNFFFLFLLLEVACVYLVVQHNSFQRAGFINSANKVAGTIYEANSSIRDYLQLKEQNEELVRRNTELLNQSTSSFMKVPVGELVINDTIYRQQYVYNYAKVVNNSTNRQNNYFTLNKGRKQGIGPDMAVVTNSGVAGVVKDVSDNFSSVMSLLHRDVKVSSKLKRDGSFGPLAWDGKDYRYALLTDIPTHVRLQKGDTVLTSAYSPTFPEGIMVGTVESYEQRPGEHFLTIKVRLSTDFKKLGYVYVVNNILKAEQDSLEKATQVQPNP
jgi:rod shape-determining protein MreC